MNKVCEPLTADQRWQRGRTASKYFQMSLKALNKIADKANARKQIGRIVLYDCKAIEDFLENLDGE